MLANKHLLIIYQLLHHKILHFGVIEVEFLYPITQLLHGETDRAIIGAPTKRIKQGDPWSHPTLTAVSIVMIDSSELQQRHSRSPASIEGHPKGNHTSFGI